MNAIWPLALITYKEGLRNRAFIGIAIFAVLLFLATLVVSGMIMRDVGKVTVDMALSALSLNGLLIVLFIGINLLAKDLDRRTIYAVLSRPISRGQYLWGKYLGLLLLLTVAMGLLSLFACGTIKVAMVFNPGYFPRFSWGMVLLAMSFTLVKLLLLTAVSFFFATLTSTSFITLVLTIVTYVIGQSLGTVKTLLESPAGVDLHVSPMMVWVVKVAYYLFPNLSFFDLGRQAAYALPVSPSYIALALGYGIIYIVLLLLVGSFCFRRREFP